jgi:hypothetical protein
VTDEEIIQLCRRGIKVFREELVDEQKMAAGPVADVDHRDAPSRRTRSRRRLGGKRSGDSPGVILAS